MWYQDKKNQAIHIELANIYKKIRHLSYKAAGNTHTHTHTYTHKLTIVVKLKGDLIFDNMI